MIKRLRFALIVCVSISLFTSQFEAAASGDEWQRVKYSYPDQIYVVNTVSQYIEYSGGHANGSTLRFNKPMGDGTTTSIYCANFQSLECAGATPTQMQAEITFPKCENLIKSWCIKSVLLYKDGDKSSEAEFVKYIDGDTLLADPSNSLPEGKTLSLWRIKGDPSVNETLFAVNVVQFMTWSPKPYFFQLSSGVYPVVLRSGKEYFAETITKNEKGSFISYGYKNSPKCENAVFTSNGECGSKVQFPANLRIGLSLVVPRNIDGFISGRLEDTKFSTSPDAGDVGSKIVSIDALPLKIPRLGLSLSKEQAVAMIGGELSFGGMNWFAEDNRQDGDILKRFEFLRKYAEDKSTGFSTVWNFTNLSANSSVKRCDVPSDSFPGLISTNAMIVDPNPPSFLDGEFVYQVAGMHYEPDGSTLSAGNYTLVISKYLSDCLYGSAAVPVSASVSIINSETGDKKISVTSIKRDSNYYTLKVSGFNFSKPEIRVRFNFAPTKSVLKKSTITCIKGKVTKKVTAISPRCPSGYKKK